MNNKHISTLKKLGIFLFYILYGVTLFINIIIPYDKLAPYSLSWRIVIAIMLSFVIPALLCIFLQNRQN